MNKKKRQKALSISKIANDKITRDTWDLNYSFIKWLGPRLERYLEVCHCDLTYHTFEYKGETVTQKACIDKLIVLCKACLEEEKECGFSEKYEELDNEIYELWSLVRHAMWW